MLLNCAGLEIGYDLQGPVDAPVVVLGHCFVANRDLWRAQVDPLLNAGLRVLRYDARGHGDSSTPAPPFTLAEMADDVVALLDALDIDQVHFCGISMSSMVGHHLALNHGQRLRSLVLSSTCSRYSEAQRAGWTARFEQLAQSGAAAVVDDIMPRWFTQDSLDNNVHGVQLMRQGFVAMDDAVRLCIMKGLRDIDTTAALQQVDLPTLVIVGDQDIATPPDRAQVVHQAIAGSQLQFIERCGHIPPTEQPAAFTRLLIEFLQQPGFA